MSESLLLDDPRAFSAIADVYDSEYSSQLTIRLQRRIYWRYLDRYLGRGPLSILDMNCGTGTDAVHMIEAYPPRSHSVMGVDIAPRMIQQFNTKAVARGLDRQMRGIQAPLQQIAKLNLDRCDIITSNFGGLNCLTEDELRELSIDLHDTVTKPGARIVAVVMPSFCLWETAYYLAKGNAAESLRRQAKGGVSANIGGNPIRTYYYSAPRFASLMEGFAVSRVTPLGTLLPPSYLDNFLRRHPALVGICAVGEKMASRLPMAAAFSDHYIIDMVRS